MARFYGQVEGAADTTASRRGSDYIKASVQSWNGSVITRMHYNGDDLMVEISISDGSEFSGQSYFYGTLESLKKVLVR